MRIGDFGLGIFDFGIWSGAGGMRTFGFGGWGVGVARFDGADFGDAGDGASGSAVDRLYKI